MAKKVEFIDILTLTQKAEVDNTDRIPVSPTEYITVEQIMQEADAATENANFMANKADVAAGNADAKALLADEATDEANYQAGRAFNAAEFANQMGSDANDAANLANTKAGLANDAAELANTKAGLADSKAGAANDAAIYANAKGDYAKEQGDYAKQKGDEVIDGYTPYVGANGNWWINGADVGTHAQGDTGNGIDKIELLSTVGLVDTYTITYTDGTTSTYTVTNGATQDISGKEDKSNKKSVINPLSETDYPNGVGLEAYTNASIFNEMYPAISHIKRVRQDGGEIEAKSDLTKFFEMNEPLKSNILLSYVPFVHGSKIRTVSPTEKYISKGYSKNIGAVNDLVQSTAVSQPFLDKVAPAEKLSVKNLYSSLIFLVHEKISFTSNQAWTVELVIKANSTYNAEIVGEESKSGIRIFNKNGTFEFINTSNERITSTSNIDICKGFNGKTIRLTVIANGLGNLRIVVNGNLEVLNSNSVTTAFDFRLLFRATYSTISFLGNLYSFHIFNKALSQPEISSRSAVLTKLFPEIPSVKIGTQEWSVRNCEQIVTPMGNIIQEVQAPSAVEKIINGNFSNSENWSNATSKIYIENGKMVFNNAEFNNSTSQQFTANPNSVYHRLEYTISDYVSGSVRLGVGTTPDINMNSNGTFVNYLKLNGAGCFLQAISSGTPTTLKISNVSIKELGWADSSDIYTAVYASTSGTPEVKEYEACKAAAMWCYYNNDPILGATYGKLYNPYAVRLFDLDIKKYNIANPTSKWGYSVPTHEQFTTLINNLGGSSLAGGKLKIQGFDYWLSPNTGATNESGFSLIGSGRRNEDGSFSLLKQRSFLASTTFVYQIKNDTSDIVASYSLASNPKFGQSLRFIKADN